jgi:iron complex outermembrane receptor protein
MGTSISHLRCVSVLALSGAAVFATATAHAATADSSRSDTSAVSELVVTAERRVENLQTAPISATVLDEKTLEAKGVTGLTALQFAAPGIQISDYASANTFNIRGIGQSQVDIDLPSGVVIYRDGVPTLTGYFQNAPYYDMAGVEVLRGPQGTFVGKSAAAGAVFIRTQDPELGHYSGEGSAGVGNRDAFEFTGVSNMPLSDTFALRLSIHGESRGSLFDSITSNPIPGGPAVTGVAGGPFVGDDDRRLLSGRIGLLWEPTSQLKIVAKTDLDYLHFGSHATTGFDPNTGLQQDLRDPIANGPAGYTDKGIRSSINVSYDFADGVKLTSLTGFSTVKTRADWDINGANPFAFYFRSGGNFTNYSQEFDLASPDDKRLTWVTGVFLQRYLNHIPAEPAAGFSFTVNNTEFLNSIGLGALAPLVPVDAPVESSPWDKKEWNYAAFGQIDYKITDALDLQIGGRVGHYQFSQFTNFKLYPTVAFLDVPLEGTAAVPLPNGHSQNYSENSFDWKVDLNYKINGDQFVYGLISRGHSPGSINLAFAGSAADHQVYKPMGVINYETGWKGSFMEGQLHTQLAVYYQTFSDYQAFFGMPAPAGSPPALAAIDSLFQARNALTTSKIYGVEFGAQGHFGDLSLDGGLALFKSQLGSFGQVNNPFCVLYSVDAACAVINPASKYYGVYGTSATVIESGAQTPFSPTVTANVGAAYTFHLAGGDSPLDMTPRIDVAYRSDTYSSLFRNPSTLLQGGFLVNLSLNVTHGPWWASLWATNLLDRTYAAAKQNVTGDPGTPGSQEGDYFPGPHVTGIVYMAPPRLFGVRVGRHF